MADPVYDALAFSKDLVATGLPSGQAEALARGSERMRAERIESLLTSEEFARANDCIRHRFDKSDERFRAIDERFDQVVRRLDGIDRRLDGVDHRLDRVDNRLDVIEGRLLSVEGACQQIRLHTWMLGLIVLVLVVPQLQPCFAP